MSRDYENFDIVFEADGPTYRATFPSLEGHPSVTFGFPLDQPDLDAFLAMFGKQQRRRLESPELARATMVGRRLFDGLFTDDLRSRFVEAVNDAKQDRKGLRVRLDLSDADDLITLPWEYLYRIEGDDFVSLSNYTPVVRYLQVGEPLPPAPLDGPLKILVMISDPIERRGTLDVEREWNQLRDSLSDEIDAGQVVLTRLADGRLESLQTELQRNDHHVFHFIGHGEFSEVHDDGVLVMEDARSRETHVPGRVLGDYLRDCLTMRLVVLNNCEGAATSESDPFAGSAQSLLRKGLPVVVAMQFEITDQAAIDFARGFYVGLMNGFPVEGALAEARKTMRRGATRVEFGSPVLYMSAADGAVFDKPEVADMPPEEPPPDVASLPSDVGAGDRAPTEQPTPAPEQAGVPAARSAAPPQQPAATVASDQPPEPPGDALAPRRAAPAPSVERSTPPDDTGVQPPPPWWKKPIAIGAAGVAGLAILLIGVLGGSTTTTSSQQTVTTQTTLQGLEAPILQPGVQEGYADQASAAIVIDGSDEEWTSRFLFESNEVVFDRNGDHTGVADTSSVWRVAWDQTHLYVYAEVVDDVASQTRSGPALFNGDALGIYFDPNLSNNAPGEQLTDGEHVAFFLGRSGEWVRLRPGGGGAFFGGANALTDDAELSHRVVETESGYAVEARIPWRLLNVTSPQPGMTFRMTRDVSDSDIAAGDSIQEHLVSNSPGRTAERQSFPEVWPVLTLLGSGDEPPELGPAIEPPTRDDVSTDSNSVVPSLVGLAAADAIDALQAADLAARVSFETSDEISPSSEGFVINQAPQEGAELPSGGLVALVVHFGPISSTEENAGKSGVLDVGLAGVADLSDSSRAALEDLISRIYPTIPMEVSVVPLTAAERFEALASGSVDLVVGDLSRTDGVIGSAIVDAGSGASIWTLDTQWGALVQANVERYVIEAGD